MCVCLCVCVCVCVSVCTLITITELHYADVTARRNTIANALELVKVTKGKVLYYVAR